jgi:hypothetical protein
VVYDSADYSNDDEACWWLGTAASGTSNYLGIHCWDNAGRIVVKMKINELIKEVNSYFLNLKAIRRDDGILIISSNDDELLLVPKKATNFMEVYFCIDNQGMYFTKANRERLSSLIEEFLKTPIKDRFPGKKYRLRWVDDNDGTSNYLDYLAGEWRLFANEDVHIFTETELQQLKINNPRFAPVIDAMKEPVEK